jgi:hypothetical protein
LAWIIEQLDERCHWISECWANSKEGECWIFDLKPEFNTKEDATELGREIAAMLVKKKTGYNGLYVGCHFFDGGNWPTPEDFSFPPSLSPRPNG